MTKRLSVLLALCMLLATAAAPTLAQDPTGDSTDAVPIIFDTDSVSDDWMAFLYLANDPGVDIKAITVTEASFDECDAGVAAMLGLVALTDYGDIPVSCWAGRPLSNGLTTEQVGAMGLPEGGQAAEMDAIELFTSTVESSDVPVTVLSLGGFTNIGAALVAKPELADKVERIYAMGGAVDVPGNQWSNPIQSAETNIYADPTAARIVFESGIPITLVGLDATNEVPLTAEFVEQLGQVKATPEAEVVLNILGWESAGIEGGWLYFWDPLAAAIITNPDLVTLTDRNVLVVDEPGPERGRSKPVGEGEGPVIQVASATDAEAFEQAFLETINQ